MARELELKLQCVEPVSWAALNEGLATLDCHVLSNASTKLLENTYYDSKDLALTKQKIALRIRKKALPEGVCYIQTLKTAGTSEQGVSARNEWEWELTENSLDAEPMVALKEWPSDLSVNALVPVFSTDFERTEQEFNYRGLRFEVVLDRGNLYAKNARTERVLSEPINEIEVEYKGIVNADFSSAKCLEDAKPESDLQQEAEPQKEAEPQEEPGQDEVVSVMKELAESLRALLPLQIADISKAQRGYAMFRRVSDA